MAELVTLAVARSSRLKEIAQSCPNSDEFKSLVNEATETLMRRGSFWGTVQKIKVCTYNGCITWPRYVGTVLAVSMCGHSIPVWNNWWDFMPMSPNDFCGGNFSFSNAGCCGNINTINDGVVPVFNQIACGSGVYIRAYPSYQADIGKKVRIYGIDTNGQVVRVKNPLTGIWEEGLEMVLAAPFVQSAITFRTITRISKEVTQGPVRYYQFDGTNLLDLVLHEPTETNPYYRHSKIEGLRSHGNSCVNSSCNGIRSVEALVKLQFIPVVADTDLVLISNLQALKNMIMSIKQDEAGNTEKAVGLEAKAIHDLNLELRDRFPNSQLPANVECFGTARLEKQMIGNLI